MLRHLALFWLVLNTSSCSSAARIFDLRAWTTVTTESVEAIPHRFANFTDFNEKDPVYEQTNKMQYDLQSITYNGPYAKLLFTGLDTIVSIHLNGKVKFCENAFIMHEFDFKVLTANSVDNSWNLLATWVNYYKSWLLPTIATHPVPKNNLLELIFSSNLGFARHRAKMYEKDYPHTVNYNVPIEPTHRNMIRKPASDFGWDWGPAIPSSAVSGAVYLLTGAHGSAFLLQDQLKIEFVYDHIMLRGVIDVTVFTTRLLQDSSDKIESQRVTVKFPHTNEHIVQTILLPSEVQKTVRFTINHPKLWWPRGLIELDDARLPFLHTVTVKLDEQIIIKRVGLRTVTLKNNDTQFYFTINNHIVDWRGVNVVPFSAFTGDIRTQAGIAQKELVALDALIDMNANAIRVWGGGAFPSPAFYNRCDELGILIWHDLPWTCAVFPANDAFLKAAEVETRFILRTTAWRPAVVMWGGNNEVEAALDWFNVTRLNRALYEADYVKLFMDTIVRVIKEEIPATPFVDSSPSNGLHPDGSKVWGDVTDPTRGDVHYYDYAADCQDESTYPLARFVSEHGVQSLPGALPRFEMDLRELENHLAQRQRHEFGFEQLAMQANRMFSLANYSFVDLRTPYENRALLSHIMQGRCLRAAISQWRLFDKNHGVLLWQLNDVWPGVSWSLLEHDSVWKQSAFEVQAAFEPIRLVVDRKSIRDGMMTVTTRLLMYAELRSKVLTIQGYVTFTPFTWDGQLSSLSRTVEVVSADIARSDFLQDFPDDAGIRTNGTFFITLVNGMKRLFTAQNEWITPPRGFKDLRKRELELHVSKMVSNGRCMATVQLLPGQPTAAYVTLIASATLGRFKRNGFLLLPGETRDVEFVFFTQSKRSECRKLNVQVKTLNGLLAGTS